MESCHEQPMDPCLPKREAVVARLKRRVEGYRNHHSQALPLYQQNVASQYNQEREHTQQLQQRYFESKAKKPKKDKGPMASTGTAGMASTGHQGASGLGGPMGGPMGAQQRMLPQGPMSGPMMGP
ncbi:hypothetical protein BIW11_03930, partial [Tropilaelaps mercedesae]